uniref:hypothetical protein n=1 Tax=Escherichia coli TaxID=562 RepID=UPI00203D34C1|nr:hypothetical protein [Escherichia coli]
MVSTTGKNMFSKPMTTFTPERIEQILEFSEGSNPSEAMSLRADEVAVLHVLERQLCRLRLFISASFATMTQPGNSVALGRCEQSFL